MEKVIFLIEEDPDGEYNAQSLGYSIFTEGETIEELKKNILDALECHFDDKKDFALLTFAGEDANDME